MRFANLLGLVSRTGDKKPSSKAKRLSAFRAASIATLLTVFSASSSQATETTTYEYDAQGRLIKSSKSGGPASGTEKCTSFDPAGNRTNQTVNSSGCSSGGGGGGGGGGSNNPPVANPNSFGVSCLAGAYPVVFDDTDPDGDTLSLLSVSGPLGATISGTTSIYVTGTNTPGSYVISYTIQDGNGGTASSTLTLTWAYNPACGGGGNQ